MELDELHTYVGHEKTTDGFGLVLVETTESTLISSLAVEGRKRDTTFVDTKEFYKMNFMKQEDLLQYGKTNLAQAVGRILNVAVVYVDDEELTNGDFDIPHYEIFSKRGASVYGLIPLMRVNGTLRFKGRAVWGN